jgi:hypothetical protein
MRAAGLPTAVSREILCFSGERPAAEESRAGRGEEGQPPLATEEIAAELPGGGAEGAAA